VVQQCALGPGRQLGFVVPRSGAEGRRHDHGAALGDQEFAQNLALTARDVAKQRNIPVVFDQNYPPNTVEFASIIRALKAARPISSMSRLIRLTRPASCAP